MPDYDLNKRVEWPFPVYYGKENEVDTGVLILGGGIAGCHAAINAAKRGVVGSVGRPVNTSALG